MAGGAQEPAWVALVGATAWIDGRFGPYARLAAGWHDMDAVCADALGTGEIRARGREGVALLPLPATPGATITVKSLCGEVTVSAPGAAQWPAMAARPIRRVYREVEIEAESLGAWCDVCLGEHPAPPTLESKGQRTTKPLEHAERAVRELSSSGELAEAKSDRAKKKLIVDMVSNWGIRISETTAARALGLR
ncbi:MAG TPA: hypothetical protein VII73_11240 [Caulobacteraceae bacterium]